MTVKFTPGPWTPDKHHLAVFAGSTLICDIRGLGHLTGRGARNLPAEEAEAIQSANAKLIAAAPDLYEAAKHAAMEWRLHGQLTDSCRVLESAIAKAEGRS